MTTEKFCEQLWKDLVSLQNFQRNLLRSEKFSEEDFEDDDDLAITDGEGNIVETADEVEEWNEKDYSHK